MRYHFRDEHADIFWSITDIKGSSTLVLILSRFVRFPNEMGNGTRLQIHTRSCIQYGVSCLRFLILAILNFLQPALRGERGPSTARCWVLRIHKEQIVAQRFGWFPVWGVHMKVQKFHSLRKGIWSGTDQTGLCVRAQWELKRMDYAREIVQDVRLKRGGSAVSLVCESWSRCSAQEELYRMFIWTGTGQCVWCVRAETDGMY
jgi:hypothetical protein